MSRFEGFTLLSELVKQPEVSVSVQFIRVEIHPTSQGHFSAEVWFAVSAGEVGVYSGHEVFTSDDQFFRNAHGSRPSVSDLPTEDPGDMSHVRNECPPSLEQVLHKLSLQFLNRAILTGNPESALMEVASAAYLKRNGDEFGLAMWIPFE